MRRRKRSPWRSNGGFGSWAAGIEDRWYIILVRTRDHPNGYERRQYSSTARPKKRPKWSITSALVPTQIISPTPYQFYYCRAGLRGAPRLTLACGTVRATHLGTSGVFDHLRAPLFESVADDSSFRDPFMRLLDELAAPGLGTKALAEALMKQCLISPLRRQSAAGYVAPANITRCCASCSRFEGGSDMPQRSTRPGGQVQSSGMPVG